MPRVSVLMPLKNAAAYVRDAVGSILSQDFEDLEVVVSDDGSTDESRVELAKIRDARLRVVDGPCRGVAAAWNAAYAAASGAIIMQCDSDDLYPPGRIGRQVALLERLPAYGSVCASFSSIDRAGRPLADFRRADQPASEITDELLGGVTRTHLNTFAIRREALVALGGKREYFESAEDIDLQLRLAEVCRVWFEAGMEYSYRIHEASLTHSQASTRRKFFEAYARELRAQRAQAGARDDLQRGAPRPPPVDASAPDRASVQAQSFLLGEAWRAHREGARISALRLGVRALAEHPANLAAWKSLAALALKSTRA
jgi:glycosyltransferase involved in cell wall biosynthesis